MRDRYRKIERGCVDVFERDKAGRLDIERGGCGVPRPRGVCWDPKIVFYNDFIYINFSAPLP